MNAHDAVRLKFTHMLSEGPQSTKSEKWCHGIMSDGSRCEQAWREHAYGFKFCRRHCGKVTAWVNQTSLDGKDESSLRRGREEGR